MWKRHEGSPIMDNSAAYGFLRGLRPPVHKLDQDGICVPRPFSIGFFQSKLKVYESIRKQTWSLLRVAAHLSVAASKTQDGEFYNGSFAARAAFGARSSHCISSSRYLSQVFIPCSSLPTWETTPSHNPNQTLRNIYLINLIYINLLNFFLTWKGFQADKLDPVGITTVSKTGFGSVQIPCTSTQDPTSERHPGQEVLCAKYSVVTAWPFCHW